VTKVFLKFLMYATLSVAALLPREQLLGKEIADHSGAPTTPVGATQTVQNNQSLQQMPRSAQSDEAVMHYKKADAYRVVLETETAISEYTAALKLEPKFDKARLGRALCSLDCENYRAAVNDLEQIDKTSPIYTQALQLAGMAHYHMLEYAAAKLDYDSILKQKDHLIDNTTIVGRPMYERCTPLIDSAQCSVMLNMPDLAIKDSSQALKMLTTKVLQRAWALRVRARAYVQLHQNDAALVDYANAFAIVKLRKDLGLVETIGGPLTAQSLLQERAKLYDTLGKRDLAAKDRVEAKSFSGELLKDAPFRTSDK
jgi:tetratricopeptide (TPR) repeat protein